MKFRIKKHHIRDFWAYVWFNRFVNQGTQYFCPDPTELRARGYDHTIGCFVGLEAVGECGYPQQPRLLKLALDGKKLVNFHIAQWAQGIVTGHLLAHEIQDILFSLPDWVCDSLERQIWKLRDEQWKSGREILKH